MLIYYINKLIKILTMEKYFCKKCNYFCDKLSHFKSHINSKKHQINNQQNPSSQLNQLNQQNQSSQSSQLNQLNQFDQNIENDKLSSLNGINDVNINNFKQIIFCCEKCNKKYNNRVSLWKHKKQCLEYKENDKILKELSDLKCELKNKDELLHKALDIAKENSRTANVSMNILKYAKLYLNDVEPLEQLEKKDTPKIINYKNPNGKESKNEEYVKIAIHRFNHGIFANFIGDMIVEHYKPKTKNNTNLIVTDTSRLCFIIMQKVKTKEQKEWINDKSGKKFIELILIPIINAVKETLIEFIEFKKTKELNENNLCLMGKCVELKRDIEIGKFTKPVLRYVAPNFHFDNLKFLDVGTDEVVSML